MQMCFALTIFFVILGIFVHELGHIIAIKITKAGEIQKIGIFPKALFEKIPAIGVFWIPTPGQKNFRIKRKIIAIAGVLSNLFVGISIWSLLRVTSLPQDIANKLFEFSFVNLFFAFLLALPIPIQGYDGWKFWKI